VKAHILAKLEFFIRRQRERRIGVSMIDAMERAGTVGPTASDRAYVRNTGIALAFVRPARGYRLILVMPESMSIDDGKCWLARAELVLTMRREACGRGAEGRGAFAADPDAVMRSSSPIRQSGDPPRTTAEEIWNDTDGAVDCWSPASAPADD